MKHGKNLKLDLKPPQLERGTVVVVWIIDSSDQRSTFFPRELPPNDVTVISIWFRGVFKGSSEVAGSNI